jgi:hypothetical protein
VAVPADEAGALAEEFGKRLEGLVSAQLGPGGSLAPAAPIVDEAIAATGPGTHVVVLTDGGIVVDGGTLQAVRSWAAQGAIVSFVEIQGQADGQHDAFHAEVLRSLGAAGGGVTLYLADEPASAAIVEQRFDELFRPSVSQLAVRFESSELSPTELTASSGDVLQTGWAATGRPVLVSVPVTVCDPSDPPATVDVILDGVGVRTITLTGAPTLALRRLELVDMLTDVLVAGCKAEPGQLTELSEAFADLPTGPGFLEIRPLFDKMQKLLDERCTGS